MIFVKRSTKPPSILIYSANKVEIKTADDEKNAAINSYKEHKKNGNLEKWSFDFTVYKDKELGCILKEMFKGKCAYCESKILAVSSPDIEHFRPKNAVNFSTDLLKPEKDVRPGYFWLAADWHNLLLSCPNCNRKAEHSIEGEIVPEKVGKHTRFPMRNGFVRQSKFPYDVAKEEKYRLLLNPCIDKPNQHLDFELDGRKEQMGLVRGMVNEKGDFSDMGQTSIKVYGLMRVDLVQERRYVAAVFWRNLEILLLNMELIESLRSQPIGNPEPLKRAIQLFNLSSLALIESLEDEQEYLGMKRQLLKRFLQKTGISELFNRFGIKLKEN